MALRLGLPLPDCESTLLGSAEISDIIQHLPPYLVLTDALCSCQGRSIVLNGRVNDHNPNSFCTELVPESSAKDGNSMFVLARASYSTADCDGHYPGWPSLPLTEIARSMDQAATLFAAISSQSRKGLVPLLRSISKLKGGSIEWYDANCSYLIWVSVQNSEIVTRFFMDTHQEPIVTISGWSYDYTEEIDVHSAAPDLASTSDECHSTEIDRLGIMDIIPQAPPFLILDHTSVFQDEAGKATVNSCAHVLPSMVKGHLGRNGLLGPMHYSRALAQSGMVLCAEEFGSSSFVPEVASAGGLWYDTGCYCDVMNHIRVEAKIDRRIEKRSIRMAVVSGAVYCCGRKVYGAESLNYIMIPRNQHPATTESD